MKKLLLCVLLSSSTVLSYAQMPSVTPAASQTSAKMINANANFYQVDTRLYRSEQLKIQELPLLKQQAIDTIINLRFFNRDEDQERFSQQGIKLINFLLKTWAIKTEQLAQILHQIELEQRQGKNVLIHCYHGADRTGVTIAMYRIIRQGWTIEQAKKEMEQGGFGYHSIWKNIDKLLTPQKVNEVKMALAKLEPNY